MKYLYILFLLVSTYNVNAQIKISGKVIDNETKQTIDFAMVSINNIQTNGVITYKQVNEKGEFYIELNSNQPEFNLEISAMNYEKLTLRLPNKSFNQTLALKSQQTILEEIIIKPTLITQRGDTLSFDLNKFATKNDRVLEDVLKKIPGIEVESSGKIKYQGQPINKFYVEGMDLMQGRYTSITQAIPNMHVSKLEVIENHQPIKMLDGKEFSDSPAINIKLKNNISVSGSAKIGVGASPFLWNTSITPMFFAKKTQFLANYDSNNTGGNLSSKLTSFYTFNKFDTYSYSASSANTLFISETSLPSISQQRYNFNKSHLASINSLFKLNKNLELNTNLFYYNNQFDRNSSQFTQIKDLANTSNPIQFYKINESVTFTENLKAIFSLTNNTTNNYLKNVTTIDVKKVKDRGDLLLNNNPIFQSVLSPTYGIQNSLSTVIPLNKSKLINVKSIIDFTNDKQTYLVTPTTFLELPNPDLYQNTQLIQNYLNKNFYTQNSLAITWSTNHWFITTRYEMMLNNKNLLTNLFGNPNQNLYYTNNLNYSFLQNTFETSFTYRYSHLNIALNTPIRLNNINLTNVNIANNLYKNAIDFTPTLTVNYKFSDQLKFNLSGNINQNYTPLDQLLPDFVFSGLNFTAFSNTIQSDNVYATNFRAEYKNPLHNIFANANISLAQINKNILLATTINQNGQQIIQAINQKNQAQSFINNITLGKYFTDLSTNLKLNFSYLNTSNNILLNNILSDVTMNSYNYEIEISNATLKWIGWVYKLNYGENHRKQLHNNTKSYINSHIGKLEFYLFKNHSLTSSLEYTESVFINQRFPNKFLDLKYRYKWNAKKIDFDLDYTNILNTKQYQQVVLNTIQTTQTNYNIRPAQIIASIRFNFK